MKKNFGENFQRLQVDPVTNEYYVTIPEWVVNELSWYEDTEIKLSLDAGDLILTEKDK
jgi:hypothetical protein